MLFLLTGIFRRGREADRLAKSLYRKRIQQAITFWGYNRNWCYAAIREAERLTGTKTYVFHPMAAYVVDEHRCLSASRFAA